MARLAAPPEADSMQDYLINWNAGPLGVVLRPDLGADMPPVVAQLLPQPSVLKMAGVQEGDLLISVNGKKTTRLGYEKVVRLLFKERLPMVLHFRSPLQVPEMQRGVSAAIQEEPTSQRTRTRRTSTSARPPPSQPQPQQPKSRTRRPSEDDRLRVRDMERQFDPEPLKNPYESVSIDSATSTKSKKNRSKKSKADAEEKRLRKQFSVVWERGSLGISFRAYNSKVNVPCVDFISTNRGQGRGMDRVCVNDVLIAINGEKTKALGVEKVLRWLHVIEKPVVLRFHASSNRILNPAGGLMPHLADDENSARPRRLTTPQPEYEPPPRPPRRNNSVEQPSTQPRSDRRGSDAREYELHSSAVVQRDGRRYSRDSATYLERQPIEEFEPQYELATSKIQLKERRYSNHSVGGYHRAQEGEQPFDDGGDFRREPLEDSGPPQFDLRIDAHIVPHRRSQHEDPNRYNQPQPQLTASRSRSNSASREDRRPHQPQFESKLPPTPVKNLSSSHSAAARPRLASRDSQVSNSSNLSFEEAASVVARATGKPVEECEFGGVPLMKIQEGTVQAKLMYIYAKACLAKEDSSDDEPASKDPQIPRTPGNPLGRKTHSKYLSYTILEGDAVASNSHIPSQRNGDTKSAKTKPTGVIKLEDISVPSKAEGDHSAEKRQDVKPQPAMISPPVTSVGPSNSISSDEPVITPPPVAEPAPADDFISLKDFVVKGDGSLTERRTSSSVNSTATPVLSTDGGADQVEEQQAVPSDAVDESNSTATTTVAMENVEAEITPSQLEVTAEKSEQAKEAVHVVKKENDPQLEAEHEGKPEYEHEHVEEHDDAASVDSSNERDLAASVASLDDLLDLQKDPNHEDEEEFVDDDDDDDEEGTNKTRDEEKVKLAQVQEEETEEHSDQEKHKEHPIQDKLEELSSQEVVQEKLEEVSTHEEHVAAEEEEIEDGALTNPLVDELFRNVPDVREIIKDKPALVVLVKKSMIDEIQEILQSLQMELQFERHSVMGVGSTASPPHHSQRGLDNEGQHCYRCGATGELAELNVADGHHELYCQDCWEMFFFSEDRQSPTSLSKSLKPSESSRLSADEDALDEALKYSFHDSSITKEDMIHPWRYLNDSMSSLRDSDASSITDRADEVWL